MGRHRSAGPALSAPTDTSRRPRPSQQESPRRAARLAAREQERRDRRTERRRRRERSRAGRSRHTPLPLRQRLLALPWVTFVLLALVAGAVVDALRPDIFEARSTVTALSRPAAAQAAVALTRADLAARVEDQVELEEQWRGTLRISVERPAPEAVVVRAEAPDPRLAALAADTAAALVVEDDADLSLSDPAVVPTGPVDGGSWWPWVLAGGAALLLALSVERRRELREGVGPEHAAGAGGAAGVSAARTAPVTSPTSPRPDPARRAVLAGGVR